MDSSWIHSHSQKKYKLGEEFAYVLWKDEEVTTEGTRDDQWKALFF